MKSNFYILCANAFALTSLSAIAVTDQPFNQALAESSGKDKIAVFVHGSDWNRLGEWAKSNIWEKATFRKRLSGYKLARVNHLELANRNLNRSINKHLSTKTPPLILSSLKSSNNGTSFKRQSDGSYLAVGKPARHESYTFSAHLPASTTSFIFDCLPHPSLPHGRAGRGSNGNFAITEITATHEGKPVKFSGSWVSDRESSKEGQYFADKLIDGNTDQRSCWSANAFRGSKKRNFILSTNQPLKGKIDFKLLFHSWNDHSLGRFSMRTSNNKELKESLQTNATQEANQKANSRFNISLKRYPAIVLVNSKGENYALIDDFSIRSTPAQISQLIDEKQKTYDQRQAWWEQSQSASGSQRIELIGKALDTKGLLFNKALHNKMVNKLRSLGSADQHPYIRKYTLNQGQIRKRVNSLVSKNKHAEALAVLQKELDHPQNSLLANSTKQSLYMIQFDLYKKWNGHQSKRYESLKKIANIDPTTHLGIGAQGYLMKDGRGPVSLTRGWFPKDIKRGRQTLVIDVDVNVKFFRAGKYKLSISRHRGSDPVRIEEFILSTQNGKIIKSVKPNVQLPDGRAHIDLQLTQAQIKKKLKITLKINSPRGTNHYGRFSVSPQL